MKLDIVRHVGVGKADAGDGSGGGTSLVAQSNDVMSVADPDASRGTRSCRMRLRHLYLVHSLVRKARFYPQFEHHGIPAILTKG